MWDDNVEAIKEKKSNNWFSIFFIVAIIIIVLLFENNVLNFDDIKAVAKKHINEIANEQIGITVFNDNVAENKQSTFSTKENDNVEENKQSAFSTKEKYDFTDKDDVEKFNAQFEKYYKDDLRGTKVKELMKKIKEYDENQYKNNTKNYIRIMIDLSKYSTKDNLSRLYLIGVNDVLVSKEEFLEHEMEIIKDDCDYYVDSYQFNSDGSIYVILITDDFNKYKYINN